MSTVIAYWTVLYLGKPYTMTIYHYLVPILVSVTDFFTVTFQKDVTKCHGHKVHQFINVLNFQRKQWSVKFQNAFDMSIRPMIRTFRKLIN